MTDSIACLDETTVVAFLGGTLAADVRPSVEAHLASCSSCSELMTWAGADLVNKSRAAGREGQPFVGQLPPGSRVDRYQVLGGIGRGGMGEVYAAYHPDLDRRIALKVVNESGAGAPERRSRLLREARAIARLSHPNVVAVYDAGTVGDRVYIAMEFVAGETIDEWLRSGTRSWQEILDAFVAAGRGLAAAHAAGVIHRDFKPQNVMVGRDGSVRVMDFGLARLAQEPADVAEAETDGEQRPQPATVTKTGALVGTLAYMAPEQFRSEPLDPRADQFSFCVAFYEALYGSRPVLAHLATTGATHQDDKSGGSRASGVPAWLRSTIARGLSPDRDRRFASMEALLASVTRGRTRIRRRVTALGVTMAALLLSIGGWRLAAARRISCAVPEDRVAGAWAPADEKDPRRQAVHRAFAATGRPSAETSWQRVSRVLDDYIKGWSAMYVQTCEATHARGEQSAAVLDLRMSCLSDNLDQVRALTNVLAGADAATLGKAVAAAHDLTPVSRCADVALLRSAVPLPRDQRTLEAVRELRTSLREAQALRDVANFSEARARAVALRPRVEATRYGPLLAELLELIGCVTSNDDPTNAEKTLHQALFTAEAAHDDATAALAAADLIYAVGVLLDKASEAEMWFHLSESILDRLGPGHERTRAWALNNFGGVMLMTGKLERAEQLARQALALKEQVLGKDHPDVAITLGSLSSILEEDGRPVEALAAADRLIEILAKNGDPESDTFAGANNSRGEALLALGKGREAEAAFEIALRIYERRAEAELMASFPLQGIGNARLLQGQPGAAIAPLEEALRIREARSPIKVVVAETRFSLGRALWESGRDRKRGINLAQEARKALGSHAFPRRERKVVDWLAEHQQEAL
jgi:eukaryotic-like serine/threonine-protein kinase